jgi:transposase InsO family protein
MPLYALQTQECYCVIFLDDYSSFGTMYFIKYKDKMLKAFQAFQAWAKNQMGHKIKTFQSDGGGEFMSKEFQTYLEQKKIERQTSMPRTPQQNGRAERCHNPSDICIHSCMHHSHAIYFYDCHIYILVIEIFIALFQELRNELYFKLYLGFVTRLFMHLIVTLR